MNSYAQCSLLQFFFIFLAKLFNVKSKGGGGMVVGDWFGLVVVVCFLKD